MRIGVFSRAASVSTATLDDVVAEAKTFEAQGFALGVQWHAEYDPQTNPINRILFEAFGEALEETKRAKQGFSGGSRHRHRVVRDGANN